MVERLNSTKPLDELKEHESDLQRQNEEDQAIIQDENASPSDIEATRERVEERNEELSHLQHRLQKGKWCGLSRKDQRDVQKIWCVGHCYLSRHGGHIRGCRQFNHKRFESHWQSFGERHKRYWRKTFFSSARADWMDCLFRVVVFHLKPWHQFFVPSVLLVEFRSKLIFLIWLLRLCVPG